MTTTKAIWDSGKSKSVKVLATLPKSQGIRIECLGNCGRLVTAEMGECRKCKRTRIHAGLKRIKRKA